MSARRRQFAEVLTAERNHYRFSVHEYHQMAEAGILTEDDRVELIDGSIVHMSPISWPHANCVDRLTQLLVLHFRGEAIVRIQNPIGLGEHDEPQPDVTVVRKRAYVG